MLMLFNLKKALKKKLVTLIIHANLAVNSFSTACISCLSLKQCSIISLLQEHPEFRGLEGLCRFLHYIPLPDEVLDFFKPVAGQIIQLLKGKAFLPTLCSGTLNMKKK